MANNIASLFFFRLPLSFTLYTSLFSSLVSRFVIERARDDVKGHTHPGLSFLHIFIQQCITLILMIEQMTKARLKEIKKKTKAAGIYVVQNCTRVLPPVCEK